ncbi:MAG: DUF3971 domain-containing protein [Desulfobulbaceae bacterium]
MSSLSQKKGFRPGCFFALLLVLTVLCGAGFWLTLRHGITLERLHIPPLTITRLSLQLDDGIVLAADRVVIQKPGSTTTGAPELFIPRFNRWAHLFRKIRIDRIIFQGREYSLLYRNRHFTIAGEDFRFSATLDYVGGEVRMEITRFEAAHHGLSLTGNGLYNRADDLFEFQGRFSREPIQGTLSLALRGDELSASLTSESFTDLRSFLSLLPIDPEGVAWVGDNITAREYRIDNLQLRCTLKDGVPDLRPDSLRGTATALDAAIRFHPGLPPVRTGRVALTLADDHLTFALDNPTYRDKNLAGSTVDIGPLLGEASTHLIIDLRTRSRLDEDILELLRGFDVDLPLMQLSGTTSAALALDFDLPEFDLRTKGVFRTGQGDWSWQGQPFRTGGAAVRLRDHLIFIDSADIDTGKNFRAELAGSIDTEAGTASLATHIEHFFLRDGANEIVTVRDLRAPVRIRFSDADQVISLPLLDTTIQLHPGARVIVLERLEKVRPYIPSLRTLPFSGGRLRVDFTDPESLPFSGEVETDVLPLFRAGEPVTRYAFQGTKKGPRLTATINDGAVSLSIDEVLRITIRDYLLAVDAESLGRKAGPSSPVPITVTGPRSNIVLKDITIPTRGYRAEIEGDNVTFAAVLKKGNILFESDGKTMSFTATDIDAMLAQDFFPFTDLDGGWFNLSLKGTDENNFEGFVEFGDVLIKDMALLNNVLSFLNAVPALATFSSPGFDLDGYQVKQGVASFSRSGGLLTIQNLRTDGATINTEAKGWIDFENDILKIDLELISLKDYSKIIDLIPWAGYALLGEDGSLSTSLSITGSRQNPEITTNLTSEIALLPINIVKRTILWPFRLFDKLRDLAAEEPADENRESEEIYHP